MKFSQAAALLPMLAASATATASSSTATATATAPAVTCKTKMGKWPWPKWHIWTTTITTMGPEPTVTKPVIPVVTDYTLEWYTVTKFSTHTATVTASPDTDTFSSTTTLYSVETDTVTSTLTTTSTNTGTVSSTSTTEVPVTAGWLPIEDTLDSYNFPGRRDVPNAKAARKAAATSGGALAYSYPHQVDCTATIPNTATQTVFTTHATVTDFVPYWKTTTKTKTLSTTTTVVPADISVTLTDTYVSSVTTFTTQYETDTISATATYTSVIPGPTVYDACSANNYFGPDFSNGGTEYFAVNVANNGPGVGSDFLVISDGASTATDCCNACQQSTTCETFLFRARNRNCFLLYHPDETCSSQSNHPNYILSQQGADTGSGYVVGNGNCGFTYSGNSDGSVFPVDGF